MKIIINLFIIISILLCGFSYISHSAQPALSNVVFWDSDVFINDTRFFYDSTIISAGNITVESGGRLEISDSVLQMSPPVNSSRIIQIKSGGILNIYNSSIISNTNKSYNMDFDPYSNGRLANTVIYNCGYYCITDWNSGIYTKSQNLSFENCTFYSMGYCILAENAITTIINTTFYPATLDTDGILKCLSTISSDNSFFTIANCTIWGAMNFSSAYLDAHGITISDGMVQNSTIIQCEVIINNGTLRNVDILSNTRENTYAMTIASKTVAFENCTIKNNNGRGVRALNSISTFTNCTIVGNQFDIFLDDIGSVSWDEAIVDTLNTNYYTHYITNDLSRINNSYFLNLTVLNKTDMTGIKDASIEISDINNNIVFKGRTGNDGTIKNIPILWRTITRAAITNLTPHKIIVRKMGAITPATYISMNQNREIAVLFKDTPPSLNVSYPPEGLITNSSFINIIGTTDNDTRISINNNYYENNNGFFNSTYWLSEGDNTIVIRATDSYGNFAEIIRNVTCLLSGPYIKIDEPKDGQYTNVSPIRIVGRTNGTRMEINGIPTGINISGEFIHSYYPPIEGKNTIIATAWDIANNTNSTRVTVFYDITPPSIEITSPKNGSYTNSSAIEICGKAPGALRLVINGTDIDLRNDGSFIYYGMLNEGINVFNCEAQDLAGNMKTAMITIYLDKKNYLVILEPKDPLLINHTEITLKGITEPGAFVTINGNNVNITDGNFSYRLRLDEGLNTVSVVSVDKAMNFAYAFLNITIDTFPPKIFIIAPEENTLKQSAIEIRIRSEADAIISINDNSTRYEGDGIFLYSTVLRKGENYFRICAKDLAGNIGTKELVLTYIPDESLPSGETGQGITYWILLPIVIIVIILIPIVTFRLRMKNGG